jgi:hypothetical protein
MKQIERAVVLVVAFAIAASVLVSVLPKLLPLVAVMFVLAIIGRWVWWLTR